ncbi:MAG TPA: hypothetical protein VFJ97_13810 [Dermatophilaceae bacterium]|nr:hypothetical protein [Dermatophilaceae bacterium]
MAVIVLCSASGSPGTTTSALALALTWPRPVLLVEADPTGGSAVFAGYLRAESAPTGSLIDLALASRHGRLTEAVAQATTKLPGRPESMVSLLPGTRAHGQARSLLPLWESLSAELKALEATGQDVIVDAGRLGLSGSPEPLLYGADLALMVIRSDLVSLSAARSWAETLRTGFASVGAASSLGLLLVGEGKPYSARDVRKVLQIPVTAPLAWDQEAADVFAKGSTAPRRFDSSQLVRSLKAATTSIQSTLVANRAQLVAVRARRAT